MLACRVSSKWRTLNTLHYKHTNHFFCLAWFRLLLICVMLSCVLCCLVLSSLVSACKVFSSSFLSSCPVLSCLVLSCRVVSCVGLLSCGAFVVRPFAEKRQTSTWNIAMCYLVFSSSFLSSCLVLSCLVLSSLVVSGHVLACCHVVHLSCALLLRSDKLAHGILPCATVSRLLKMADVKYTTL